MNYGDLGQKDADLYILETHILVGQNQRKLLQNDHNHPHMICLQNS